MTLTAGRKRLVTFRVTQEEYEALKQFCIAEGARSISEFIRDTVVEPLSSSPRHLPASGDMMTLITVIEKLGSAVTGLTEQISKMSVTSSSGRAS